MLVSQPSANDIPENSQSENSQVEATLNEAVATPAEETEVPEQPTISEPQETSSNAPEIEEDNIEQSQSYATPSVEDDYPTQTRSSTPESQQNKQTSTLAIETNIYQKTSKLCQRVTALLRENSDCRVKISRGLQTLLDVAVFDISSDEDAEESFSTHTSPKIPRIHDRSSKKYLKRKLKKAKKAVENMSFSPTQEEDRTTLSEQLLMCNTSILEIQSTYDSKLAAFENVSSVDNDLKSTSNLLLFYKSHIANQIRINHKRKFHQTMEKIMSIKNKTDQASLIGYYKFVTRHFTRARDLDIDFLKQLYIFHADLNWSDWKNFLTKTRYPLLCEVIAELESMEDEDDDTETDEE